MCLPLVRRILTDARDLAEEREAAFRDAEERVRQARNTYDQARRRLRVSRETLHRTTVAWLKADLERKTVKGLEPSTSAPATAPIAFAAEQLVRLHFSPEGIRDLLKEIKRHYSVKTVRRLARLAGKPID
jgi:hypothetical protein